MGNKRWLIKDSGTPEQVAALSNSLNDLPEPITRALILRGIETFEDARSYFRSGPNDLHDPMLYKDMDRAVERVIAAIRANERIVVYGDYDVDGTTSTALLTDYLLHEGVDADFFVPDRFQHGYGLSTAGINAVKEKGATLIIALDCGVTSTSEAEYARSLGMDLIVCDHHTPQEELPNAVAVLDAKRSDCPYPFTELCGCGVTYKLVQAIHAARGKDVSELDHYLDLVGIATAADMVSLKGENRILLRKGIERLRTNPRIGLRMLADQAKVTLSEATTRDILFSLGPRINAAGRLGDAARAVTLLMSTTSTEAAARARQLERLNEERRALDQQTQKEAFAMADRFLAGTQRHAVVLHNPDWHLGVIGIVASRLVERHYRPAVMLSTSSGIIKGSARSINGINVFAALSSCEHLLLEFGGHDYAAGLSLKPDDLPEFITQFDAAIAGTVTEGALEPVVEVDAEMHLSDLDTRFWAVLKQFEPFGQDNPPPVFLSRSLDVIGPVATVGRKRDHIKFSVRASGASGTSHPSRDVIGFGLGKHLETVAECQANGQPVDLLFSIDENTWNGRTKLQLLAKDVVPSTS